MSNVLVLGTGGCGGKLLNTYINLLNKSVNLQSIYDGIFINSNVNEMKLLDNYNPNIGLAINGGGTGRNQQVAKESIAKDKSKFLNYFRNKIDTYDTVLIFTSMGGGFGSGSISVITNVLRQLKPSLAINIVGVMPSLKESKASLENALSSHETITKLRIGKIINSVQYIDNDKMDEEDEEEFNEKTMKLVLDSYELHDGAVDVNDTKLINSANKYKVILPLKNKFKSLIDAIDYSIDNSPFVIPNNLDCSHFGGIFVKGEYNKDEWKDLFKVKTLDKTDYGSKNLLVLGGTSMPIEYIQTLEEAYNNIQNEMDDDNEEIFEFNKNKTHIKEGKETTNKEAITKDKLLDMMDADFWN